jgi:hypothetical protein
MRYDTFIVLQLFIIGQRLSPGTLFYFSISSDHHDISYVIPFTVNVYVSVVLPVMLTISSKLNANRRR